ncbi:hypothetical protein ACFXJ5_09720 [Streptomyces sp. NPDC059373]|jgi:hypothetical protein
MPALSLFDWTIAFAIDQIVSLRWGVAGAISLGLITAGHKSRNVTFQCAGIAVLAVLLAQ